jgi:hypothetical protein
MKRILSLFVIAILILTSVSVYAARTTKTGTTSAQFLKIGTYASTLGMGESAVANPIGLSAIHWNPAGLSRYHTQEAAFSQSNWLAGTQFLHVSAAMDLDRVGVISAYITNLDYGDMVVRTELKPEGTGEIFSASDMSIGISYAINLTDHFSIGGSFKYISQQIWHMSASTVAFDIGSLFITPFKDIRIGMSITNFGGQMTLQGRDVRFFSDPAPELYGSNDQIPAHYELASWPIPLTFRVGLSGDLFQDSRFLQLTWAFDALHPSDNAEYINIGTELMFFEKFFLRTGMRTLFGEDKEGGLTFGAGLKYAFSPRLKIKLDYAWADFGVLEDINMITLSIIY